MAVSMTLTFLFLSRSHETHTKKAVEVIFQASFGCESVELSLSLFVLLPRVGFSTLLLLHFHLLIRQLFRELISSSKDKLLRFNRAEAFDLIQIQNISK